MNGRCLLVASVISVQNSNFVYPSCQNCFSKLLLDLKRYSCLKCGCSGDTKEANYRYRLTLEVADTQGVFEVTVFGSCLDVYFGITAKGLQRYIEKLNQETGKPDWAAAPGVIFQAVETCFIGKKFVFGIKGFDRPDGTSSFQNNRQMDRYPKALIACQMFVPNPELTGYTVIHYLQQQQQQQQHSSRFKSGDVSFWPSDLFAAFDEPSRELSSLPGSGDLSAAPSSSADGLSYFWPQSFGVTCSSTASATAADLREVNSSMTVYDEQKWESNAVSLHGHSTYDSQHHNLTVTKMKEEEDKKCHLFTTRWEHVTAKSESEGYPSLGGKDCRLVQTPLKSECSTYCEIIVQSSCGQQKSGNPFLQSFRCPLASSSSHARACEGSREAPEIWDELPSSESLNEFIANIENAAMLPRKGNEGEHFPDNRTDEFCGKLTPKPEIFSFRTNRPKEKLQNLPEKVEKHKEPTLPYHQLLLHHSNTESHQQAFHNSYSTEEKKEWGYLSSQDLLLLPGHCPAGVHVCHSKESCSSSKGRVHQGVHSFKNHHSGCSIKSTSKCLEDSGLPIRKIIARLSNKDNGNLANGREKEASLCKLNRTTDLIGIQEGLESAICEKANEICGEERELLLNVHKYSFKGKEIGLLQDCFDCPEGSYNASADLFDSSRGTEATGRKLNAAHTFLAQVASKEHPVTRQPISFEFIPSKLDASWNISGYRSTSHSRLTISDQKTSTPVSDLRSRSELSLAGSLNFIPNSQSTPLARTSPHIICPRGKESMLGESPLKKLSQMNGKCKRLRPSVGHWLRRRLVDKFLKSHTADSTVDPSAHQLFTHSGPLQELSANSSEDWVSPSEKKWRQPLTFQKKLKRRTPMWNGVYCQAGEKSLLSENKVSRTPRNTGRLIKVEISQKRQALPEVKDGSHKNEINDRLLVDVSPGRCALADTCGLNMPSTSHPLSTVSNFSPELF